MIQGIGEYESIEPNPNQSDSVIVAFKERYQAEKFMFSPRNIPAVGEVEFAWIPNPPITVPAAMPSETKNGFGDDEQDTVMDSADPAPAVSTPPPQLSQDMDYDVAEDDSWGA
jgi:hypothetical protein